MPRWSDFDTDEERLPEGFKRIGYDADTQVYTFRDAEGKEWESAPGNRYGRLHPVSGGTTTLPSYEDDDDEDGNNALHPFTYGGEEEEEGLYHQQQKRNQQQEASWRHDMMPLLNWFLLVGLFLLGVIWFISRGTSSSSSSPGNGGEDVAKPIITCNDDGAAPYTVVAGDTCWDIAEARGVSVETLLEGNEGLDCDALVVGGMICVPETT